MTKKDDTAPFKEREKQIIRNTEKYNQAAELFFKRKENDSYLKERPFVISKSHGLDIQIRFSLLTHALDISITDIVLDFGAGTCWISALLNRMGVKTISLDVSKTALDIGKETFNLDKRQKMNLDPVFMIYNGHKFPLSDNYVDRIICFDAFHHVPNKQEILNEMYRVLKHGGKVGLAEPGEEHSISPDSIRDGEIYGVLESDICLDDLKIKSRIAGFDGFFLKPYMIPNSITLTLEEYFRLREDKHKLCIGHYINHPPIIILSKGKERVDSRHPNILKAKIHITDQINKINAGDILTINAKVKNIGDTIWLSSPHGHPCCVALGVREVDKNEKIDLARGFLNNDIIPGDEDVIVLNFRLPKGRHILELDMVNEHMCWFCERDSESLKIEIDVA